MVNIPPCGVVDDLLRDIEPDPVERYRMWLLLHRHPVGNRIVNKMVLDRCLPDDVTDLVALGEVW